MFYAEETPRKATARRMILMVQSINKTNFGGARVVTCYTCHRNVQGAPKITPSLAGSSTASRSTPDPNEVEIRRQAPGDCLPPIRFLTSTSRRSEERRRQPPSPASSSRAHTRGMQNPGRLWTFTLRLQINAL